jgi:hypothetical protein
MTKPQPKPLTAQQIHLLKILYKFRFITAELAGQYKGVSTRAANIALGILLKNELVHRRYDKSYKLLGKAARYYLAPKALKLLRDEYGLNSAVLHARYKDAHVSEVFVDHTIKIVEQCTGIRSSYPNMFTLYTKWELADNDEFPQPLPDLYVTRINESEGMPTSYFLDIVNDTQPFLIKKRIAQYIEHYESGDWNEVVYPSIILVCVNAYTAKKLSTYIQDTLDNAFIEESELSFICKTAGTLTL